jgi:hypothetical protein
MTGTTTRTTSRTFIAGLFQRGKQSANALGAVSAFNNQLTINRMKYEQNSI